MVSLQQEGASLLEFLHWVVVPLLFLFSVLSQKPQGRGGGGKMIISVVEAVPTSSKPPAADDVMRTSMGRRCGFGASVPLLTRASPMPFSGARGSAI